MNDPTVNPDRSRPDDTFLMRLPVRISAIEEGRLSLLAYLAPLHLDVRLINRVEVVLEEMISNVVRHATAADSLLITAKPIDSNVLLTVEDNGAAFNPLEVPEPAPFDSLEDATLGGQGVPLIKRLSKSVSYRRTSTGNRISALVAST